MRRAIELAVIAVGIIAAAACATTQPSGYVICNDLAANVTCPDSVANIVIGM